MTSAQSEVNLRPARADETAALSELSMRTKKVWGYDDDFMAACRAELAITSADIAKTSVVVADLRGRPVAVAQVVAPGGVAVLEKLFVAPELMGQGIGRLLFGWAIAEAFDEERARSPSMPIQEPLTSIVGWAPWTTAGFLPDPFQAGPCLDFASACTTPVSPRAIGVPD